MNLERAAIANLRAIDEYILLFWYFVDSNFDITSYYQSSITWYICWGSENTFKPNVNGIYIYLYLHIYIHTINVLENRYSWIYRRTMYVSLVVIAGVISMAPYCSYKLLL